MDKSEQSLFKVSIFLNESYGIERKSEPVTFGIPFKMGQVFDIAQLAIQDKKKALPYDFEATAYWPDKSIKWALVNSQIDLLANESKQLNLVVTTGQAETKKRITVTEQGDSIFIDTGESKFVFGANCLLPIPVDTVENIEFDKLKKFKIVLNDNQNCQLNSVISNRIIEVSNREQKTDVVLEGEFLVPGDLNQTKPETAITFISRCSFYAAKPTVKVDFTLTNPNAAVHPEGKWDLGDEGSFYFNDLSLVMSLPESSSVLYKQHNDSHWESANNQKFSLFQCSSGGQYWNSPNHINHNGVVPIEFKGFRILNGENKPIAGDRANPLLAINNEQLKFSVRVTKFWQQFPKAFSLDNSRLRVSLFPKEFGESYELQGGEQKTHSLYFDFGDDKNALIWCECPIQVSFSPEYIRSTNVINWLSADIKNNPIAKLIKEKGLYGERNFFAKRETIDEYGWRNFGEVYADHESLGHKGNVPLISHYNNQYDALFGFARMYLQSGEIEWFELMNDLADHVVDIDIYNTNQDRQEYNGGLFWHTNHYLNVETCTHRTYSKRHVEYCKDAADSGGPGDEHCYTTGLLTHYFLTGSQLSKAAVIKLADWSINLHEGQGLLLERILLAKKKDLVTIKQVMKGEKLAKTKYPFTRGTGNYISTLIDAYSISGELHYLELVESVIRQSIHPDEDLSLRRLDQKEQNWSYIIFLQSLAKYLELKSGMNDFNDDFYYARDSLLNVTEWIMEHEYPLLEKPEILEYPNMTWMAQDLRKAQILFVSSQYTMKSKAYIEKAHYYVDYVLEKLQNHPETEYSRILILLMQNQGPEDCFPLDSIDENKLRQINHSNFGRPRQYSVLGITIDLGLDLIKRLMHFSITNELAWLNCRKG